MLAYRHAFHAGNHGDVLKHLLLQRVVAYLQRKDKGVRFIDTHAGAGGYSLEGRYARTTGEAELGVARLWKAEPPPELAELVAPYLDAVRALNPTGRLQQLPGSPALLKHWRRPQDELCVHELHTTDHRILASFLAGEPGVSVSDRDGFEGLKAHLPPPTRRALVLMDPSYELDADYARVVTAVREALARLPSCTLLIWYPLVQKVLAHELPRRLKASAPKDWLDAQITVAGADARGFGMTGSGVFALNPPHGLEDELRRLLPWLAATLATIDEPSWRVEAHRV
jgi:23S rRNA (adenine2030-N6)-methyltransferase